MDVSIRVQHMATVRELKISLMERLTALKEHIESIFQIPATQQSLTLDGRNISTAAKPLGELGIREGALVVVRRIHQFRGQTKEADVSSVLKNPMVKGMLKNPEMLKSLQDMFPELKEELSNNKTLSMILNSSGLDEELEKMTTDNDYMSLQLRNADVTMAKLENIPGGINMMSGMMKEAEDPFRSLSHGPNLKGGYKIDERITSSLPGSSKQNSLVEYRKQLSELKEIGFDDVKENIEVLKSVDGDLEAALEVLTSKREIND